MRHTTSHIACGLLLTACFYAPALATPTTTKPTISENPISKNDVQSGSLLFKSETPGRYHTAPMIDTDVSMNISGPVIRTTLSQTFKNTTDEWVEGIYVFPLPENAAVDRLKIVVGNRLIEGKIKEKQEAKRIYETAKAHGKKAGLVEQERPNMFTTSVANIGPHETVAIQIEYQDKADIRQGEASLIFPMVVGPRYSPPPVTVQVSSASGRPLPVILDPVLDRNRISPPVMDPRDEPVEYLRLPVSISINLDAGFDLDKIDSPYHAIRINKSDADSAKITLKDGQVPANRDFKLTWNATPNAKAKPTIFRQDIGNHSYLLSMVMPPKIETSEIENHARENLFIIDTSGSMGGTSIIQARKALLLGLDKLEPQDSFNITRFSTDHSSLFSEPQPATDKNIMKAINYVKNLQADGGTNMHPALQHVLNMPTDKSKLRQVVFITDGSIGNEKQLFALIKDKLDTARLFPVGIGSAPNRYFMSRAAKFGRGTSVTIGDISEVQEQMGTLFTSLDNPVITNLDISLLKSGESFPSKLPDLYDGEPLINLSKVETVSLNDITLSGETASSPWIKTVSLSDTVTATGLDVLWARRKIQDLEDNRFDRNTAHTIDAEILKTALDHHIVSRLTSLVAVDVTPSRDIKDPLYKANVPTMLPEGWDFAKLAMNSAAQSRVSPAPQPVRRLDAPLHVPMPRTASPHVFLLILGVFMMGLSRLFRRKSNSCAG